MLPSAITRPLFVRVPEARRGLVGFMWSEKVVLFGLVGLTELTTTVESYVQVLNLTRASCAGVSYCTVR